MYYKIIGITYRVGGEQVETLLASRISSPEIGGVIHANVLDYEEFVVTLDLS